MSKKYRQQYKRRTLPSVVKQKEKATIQYQVKRLEAEVNQKLKSLSKMKNGLSGIAYNNLSGSLSTVQINSFDIVKGRVNVSKQTLKSKTKSTYVAKKLNNFLRSMTSTKKGKNIVKKNVIEGMKKAFIEKNRDKFIKKYGVDYEDNFLFKEDLQEYLDYIEDISLDEAEILYNMFGDDDYKFFEKTFNLSGSEFISFLDEAREQDMSIKEFDNYMNKYIVDLKDTDYKSQLISIYNKYVNY